MPPPEVTARITSAYAPFRIVVGSKSPATAVPEPVASATRFGSPGRRYDTVQEETVSPAGGMSVALKWVGPVIRVPAAGRCGAHYRRRRASAGHGDADVGGLRQPALGVTDLVAELVEAGEAGLRRVHERAVRTQQQGAIGDVAEQQGRQGEPWIRAGVVVEHARSRDDELVTLLHLVAVVPDDRRAGWAGHVDRDGHVVGDRARPVDDVVDEGVDPGSSAASR